MKTLLIDNYDSFTFNLFQQLAEINGEPPLVVRNDELTWQEAAALPVDNIVISPGPGRPERPADFGICRQAILESPLPILGICLGHQGIGHLCGGRVEAARVVMHGRLSEVLHEGEDLFAGLPSPFAAVRYHSLVVSPDLPPSLRPLAWTRDGVLMGLAHRSRPLWGVQFHPESICSEHGPALLANFRDLSLPARRSRPVRVAEGVEPMQGHPAPPQAPAAAPLRLHHRRLVGLTDPEAAFQQLFAASPEAYWLHSAVQRDGMARFSIMGDGTGPLSFRVSYRSRGRELTVIRGERHEHRSQSVFDFLSEALAAHRIEPSGLPFDFAGGFVGYLGYELKQECGAEGPYQSAQPDALYLFADRFIVFDHTACETWLLALTPAGAAPPEDWLDAMEAALAQVSPLPPPVHPRHPAPVVFHLQQDRDRYLAQIHAALTEIEAGESYEVCLTHQLRVSEVTVEPFALYRILQQVNPAPFSAFLKFPEVSVLSSSPERFLRIDRDGRVEAKPIKGTQRRSADPKEDARLARELREDEKNRAENLMIVDLLRNDLGRVCEIGSVAVPKLMEVESYATVHQLVSTVTGRLAPGRTALDCVRAAFPGGSMTGAPKRRTLEIIDRLEGHARGVYSGSLGYFSLDGAADQSIVIRTIVAAGNELSMGVGGAIVALSDPEAELEETLLKARALIRAILIALRGAQSHDIPRIEGLDSPAPEVRKAHG